jgi:hypothetical protein
MISLKTIAAAALFSTLTATPVFAQAAIQEPGAFAFYYPYRDVLNGGAPTPAARLILEGPAALQAYAAIESGFGPRHLQRYRSHHTGRHRRVGRSQGYAVPGWAYAAPRPPVHHDQTPRYDDPSKFGGGTALPATP